MAIRPNDEQRSFGTDREQQREVTNENTRSARPASGDTDVTDSTDGSSRSRSNRGFASMDRSKQREIASKGGRAAHQKGTAHEFDSGEARAAGRKGGVTVSKNREHMAAIGRRGGEARGANRAARLQQDGEQPTAEARPAQTDREVSLNGPGNEQRSIASSPQRQSTNSLGGESRTLNAPERNVERP